MSQQQLHAGTIFEGAGKPAAVGRVGERVVIACEAPGSRSPMNMSVYQLRLWDFDTGNPLGPWIAEDKGVERAAVGEFAGRLVIACGGKGGAVRVWDATTGELFGRIDVDESWIEALAIHDFGGDLVCVVSGGSHTVRAWSVGAHAPLTPKFGQWKGRVFAVAAGYLHGNPVIATMDDKGVHLWSLAQRALVHELPSGDGTGYALDLANLDGKAMVISICEEQGAAYSDRYGTNIWYSVIRLWDVRASSASGIRLACPIIRARGVTAGKISGKVAIVSIYQDGGEIQVWYPSAG